jgi:hypothetical protein
MSGGRTVRQRRKIMSSRWLVIGLFVMGMGLTFLGGGPGQAGAVQEEPAEKERVYPGEEYEKLSAFVGTWEGIVNIPGGEHGPGGKVKAVQTFEPILDGYCIEMNHDQAPLKKGQKRFKGHGVLTWDTDQRMYRFWWFDNEGRSLDATGTWKNDVLRFKFEFFWRGAAVEQLVTFKTITPTKYHFEIQIGFAEKPMNVVYEGTLEKKS